MVGVDGEDGSRRRGRRSKFHQLELCGEVREGLLTETNAAVLEVVSEGHGELGNVGARRPP